MIYSDSADDYRPLMWFRGHPIGVSILLIVLHTAAMVIFSIARATGHSEFFETLLFSSDAVLHRAHLWQLVTYVFVALPSINFALQMLMLYWFGPEVERFVGRTAFIGLYLALILIPALFLLLIGLAQPVSFSGADNLLFGFFIAFVTIYPNVEVFLLRITAKWLAWIFLGIYTLIYFSEQQFLNLAMLWLCAAIGYFGMRTVGVGGRLLWWQKWNEDRKERNEIRRSKVKAKKENKASIDAILEKISRKGMGSLTASEKSALENARSALLKRDEKK